jgi:DNA repair protein RecN (Recombination protein N)
MGFEIEDDEPLILRRELSANGRSFAQVAGRMVTVKQLAAIAENLVDIHSQHAQQSLVQRRWQRQALDRFAGTDVLAAELEACYREWSAAETEWQEWQSRERELRRNEDLLRFQLDEINKAQLREEEQEILEQRETMLANAEEIGTVSTGIGEMFDDEEYGILPRLQQARRLLRRLQELDPDAGAMGAAAEEILIQATDLSQNMASYSDNLEIDPSELSIVQDRLHLIAQLKKKYGSTIGEILTYAGTIENQLNEIGSYEDRLAVLEQQTAEHRDRLETLAAELTAKRKKAAGKLAKRVEKELGYLGMKDAVFTIVVETTTDIQSYGAEHVELRIAVNPGEDPKPLGKVASGGELSRITLALKCITTGNDDVQILLFDEIDSGISAGIASAVGERLQELGTGHQVFVITHMPHIACRGDAQFTVSKKVKGDRTVVIMKELAHEERRKEIARMLGGESSMTLAHADELFESAAGSAGE